LVEQLKVVLRKFDVEGSAVVSGFDAVATKLAEEIDFRQIDDFIAAPAQNRLERE
jgi:hypothetical protein